MQRRLLRAGIARTQRSTPSVDETESYLGVLPTASPFTVEAAGAWAAEQAQAERNADAQS